MGGYQGRKKSESIYFTCECKKGTSVGVVAEQQGFNDYALIVAEIIDFMNSDNKMIQDDMDEILGLLQDGVAGTRNSKHKDDEL